MTTYADFDRIASDFLATVTAVNEKARHEYARDEKNVFANFERVGGWLDKTREEVLLTYLFKHLDGIISYVRHSIEHREPIEGRFVDAVVYLMLLYAMIVDRRQSWVPADAPPEAFKPTLKQPVIDEDGG